MDGFDIIVGVQRWEMADSAMMNNEVAKAMRGKGIGEDEGNWGTEENTFDWIKEWMGTIGWRDVNSCFFQILGISFKD